MKKLTIAFIAFFFAGAAGAQELSLGLRAGISRSSMVRNFADFSNTEAITGFTGGAYVKAKVLGFFLMPEIMYNQRGGEVQSLGQTIAKNTVHYIDVPVLAGKQFFKVLRVNAGPVLQFAIASDKVQSGAYTNNSEIRNFVLGLQAGVGADLFRFSVDVRYDTGLSDATKVIVSSASAQDITYSSRASMWLFTFGYRLFKI